ncbi:acetyl/propionyl/methylcrotonyl-CoA carboxylase subunit alpha [Marinactinospora thermotolerans]|uniref:acetyl/propionyl/methylcrotonyl-CoA carboxylase subunit alpha n=1 Tax=Marinactinospora thermotolerans TaxID=531310 RepID=UPI003D8B2371
MITTLLVANRGEIARRILRTCRDLGVATVAVHSDPDAHAPHVREADAAVRLPGAAPADTYLRGDLLVAAAKTAGADAVHPGYGFLSENAGFAREVIGAGLTWVGPRPRAIELMGSKVEAKRLMAEAGVPVLAELDPAAVTEADLPVLVKASAGGGGRGMRVVRSLADLPAAVESARSEAAAAFGDPLVFCERYVESGRHIEVQVLADAHGTVWALGERDCSVQRRHQKLVEETPAPGISAALRRSLHEAAIRAAERIDYVGAGTVEFLVAPDGGFAFLEMNTRLQVEHPVTECVTGLDLVERQIRIAEGRPLEGRPPAPDGHAVEARLYAEDPARDWAPGTGTVLRFEVPGTDAVFRAPDRAGIRVDSGVEDGSEIGTHYDAMLAKVVAWAPEREDALRRLAGALARARLHGPVTNRDLLVRVLRHPAFLQGEVHTRFLEEHAADGLTAPQAGPGTVRLAALAAALAESAARRARAAVLGAVPAGWRNLPSQPRRARYATRGAEVEAVYRSTRSGPSADGVVVVAVDPDRVVLEVDGLRHPFTVTRHPGLICVDSALGAVELTPLDRFPDPADEIDPANLVAPMPGTVRRVEVREGERVEAGRVLLWLEAMKMEHRVTAPAAGTVTRLPVAPGTQVGKGTVLAVVSPDGPDEASEPTE